MTKRVNRASAGIRNRAAVTYLSPAPEFARRQEAAVLSSQLLPLAAEDIVLGMIVFSAGMIFLQLDPLAAYFSDAHASSTVTAASFGVVAPAAKSAEMSFTTRPTFAPSNWS